MYFIGKVFAVTIAFSFICVSVATSIEVSGDVWGVWKPDENPYEVVGELRVPPGSTLVILPGCYIDFQGHYKFIIDSTALFQAIGTETDSIIFTTVDTVTGWHSLRFFYADSGSQISYSRIEYGKANEGNFQDREGGGISSSHSYLTISSNTFSRNYANEGGAISTNHSEKVIIENNYFNLNQADYGGAIALHSDYQVPTFISNNIFDQNSYGALFIWSGYCDILDNTIINNFGTTIVGWFTSYINIKYNIIVNNSELSWSSVMSMVDCSVFVINNTICNNSSDFYGIGYFGSDFTPTTVDFRNNIVWGNIVGNNPLFECQECILGVDYSDIQGGWGGFGNIDADPIFVDTANGDFNLQWGSPCIDAGDPNSPYDPDGTRADMGALFFDQSVGINDKKTEKPADFILYKNYPNPFNESTTIKYSLPLSGYIKLCIYNIIGQQIESLYEGQSQAGNYHLSWNVGGLPSGVYFACLKSETGISTIKMVLVR